jgi:plastocyanin
MMGRLRRLISLVGLMAVVGFFVGSGAGGSPASAQATDVAVTALGYRFAPGEDYATTHNGIGVPWPDPLQITRGTRLVFKNSDPTPHTLTSDGCTDGAGYKEPEPAPPMNILADAFDHTIFPTVFGQPDFPEGKGRCWFDSRGRNPNGFTAQGASVVVDTSKLPPGDYRFHCVIHDFMQGTLHVTKG